MTPLQLFCGPSRYWTQGNLLLSLHLYQLVTSSILRTCSSIENGGLELLLFAFLGSYFVVPSDGEEFVHLRTTVQTTDCSLSTEKRTSKEHHGIGVKNVAVSLVLHCEGACFESCRETIYISLKPFTISRLPQLLLPPLPYYNS